MLIHKHTHKVFQHWRQKRLDGALPARRLIEPAALERALGAVFILEQKAGGGRFRFQLSGSRLCSIVGFELTGHDAERLILPHHTTIFRQGLAAIHSEHTILVLELTGMSNGNRTVSAEAVFMPIELDDKDVGILGALEPLGIPTWLGSDAIVGFRIDTLRMLDMDRQLFSLQNRPGIPVHYRVDIVESAATPHFDIIEGRGFRPTNAPRPQLKVIHGGRQ